MISHPKKSAVSIPWEGTHTIFPPVFFPKIFAPQVGAHCKQYIPMNGVPRMRFFFHSFQQQSADWKISLVLWYSGHEKDISSQLTLPKKPCFLGEILTPK